MSSPHRLAWLRKAEIHKLTIHRINRGYGVDAYAIAEALADVIASAPARHGQGQAKGWPALDEHTLRTEMRIAGLSLDAMPSDEDIRYIIGRTEARHRQKLGGLPADDMARLLGISYAERTTLCICAIGAIDFSEAERIARRATKSAERSRAWREAKKDGQQMKVPKMTVAAFCKIAGISTKSFYKRKSTVAVTVANDAGKQRDLPVRSTKDLGLVDRMPVFLTPKSRRG